MSREGEGRAGRVSALAPDPEGVTRGCDRIAAPGRIGEREEAPIRVACLAPPWASLITGAAPLGDRGLLVPGGMGFGEGGPAAAAHK